MSGRMAATVQEKEDVERELWKQREAANVLQSELEAEKAALASKRAEGERLTLLVAEKGTEAASARADESRVRSELEAAAERYAALEAKIQVEAGCGWGLMIRTRVGIRASARGLGTRSAIVCTCTRCRRAPSAYNAQPCSCAH